MKNEKTITIPLKEYENLKCIARCHNLYSDDIAKILKDHREYTDSGEIKNPDFREIQRLINKNQYLKRRIRDEGQ